MTYVGQDACWFFDLGGDFPLHQSSLLMLRKACHMKKVSAFLSHFDKDHIQFYKNVDQVMGISTLYLSHLDAHTVLAQKLLDYFKNRGAKVSVLKRGDTVSATGAHLRCVWPDGGKQKDENSRSLTFIFESVKQRTRILLTGDLPGKVEPKLDFEELSILNGSKIDVLKVAHHGSHFSTFIPFLNIIKPKACVVSVARHNKYRHPRQELLDRLTDSHCAILRTDILGTITLEL